MSAVAITPPIPALVLFGRDHAGKPHASWFDAASAELATKAAGLMSMRAVPIESDELRELVTSLPRGRLFSSGRAFTPFIKGKLYERLVEVTRDVLGLEMAAVSESEAGAEASQDGTVPTNDAAEREADGEPPADEEAAILAEAPAGELGTANAVSAGRPAEPAAKAATAAKPVGATAKPSARPSRAEEIGPGSLVLATTGAAEGWYEARVIGVNGSTFTLKWADFNEASFVRRGNELGFLPRLPA